MDFAFDKLIEFNIKRLTRPKFRHEFAQFNDPVIFQDKTDLQKDSDDTDDLNDAKKAQLWKE